MGDRLDLGLPIRPEGHSESDFSPAEGKGPKDLSESGEDSPRGSEFLLVG